MPDLSEAMAGGVWPEELRFSGGITMFEKGDFEWCEECMCEDCANIDCANYQCKNCDGTCEEHCTTYI